MNSDNSKPRYDLLAPEFIEGLARVMTDGAKKHGSHGWTSGRDWSRLFAAAMRHCWTWQSGVDLDAKSRESHLLHAAANLMMLYGSVCRNIGTDDRRVHVKTET